LIEDDVAVANLLRGVGATPEVQRPGYKLQEAERLAQDGARKTKTEGKD
jgi:hypothetical protein